jgi:hypothetical protein
MTSSTSSSERVLLAPPPQTAHAARRWARPLALVLLALVFTEAAARLVLVPASRDLAGCASFPARARALFAAPGPHLVVVGNSSTRGGVDPQLLEQRLDVRVGVFAADSGMITSFYWILTHVFFGSGLKPPVVVVPYFGDQLADGEAIDVGRLSRYFSTPYDWAELFRFDLVGLDQRAALVLSWLSAAYATRARLKSRVLDVFPDYETSVQEANRVLRDHDRRKAPPHRFETLRRLIGRAQQNGTRICFVAMPMRDERTAIPDPARRIVRDGGMELLDLRQIDGLGAQHFADFVHLNGAGRAVFSEALASALAATGCSATAR